MLLEEANLFEWNTLNKVAVEFGKMTTSIKYRKRCYFNEDQVVKFLNFTTNIPLSQHIDHFFTWSATKDGHIFWSQIKNTLKNYEYEHTRISNSTEYL